MKIFTCNIESKCNAALEDITSSLRDVYPTKILGLDLEDKYFLEEYNRTINSEELPHIEDENELFQGYNTYIGMELGFPGNDDGELQHAVVKSRAVDIYGTPIGTPHDKTMYDNFQYEVKFLNSETKVLTENIIAEYLLAQVDK